MEHRETPVPIDVRSSDRVELPTFASGQQDVPEAAGAPVPPAGEVGPVGGTRITLLFSDR